MKRLFGSLLAAALLIGGAAHAESYNLDPAHAFAIFKVDHLGIAPSYGQFIKVGGSFDYDAAAPEKSKVKVEIDADSIFTGDKKRDDHLKGPDFFDTKQFPKLSFESTSFTKAGENTYTVAGNLTMHGQTRPMTITLQKTGAGKDPWGNDRVGFATTFTLNRLDFGVSYMPDGLGKEVTVMISAEGIKKK
ncbi:MAG: YceI family protein [Myxococcales bacterium]|nr:YceI family protein [Myxococcales bacterium]